MTLMSIVAAARPLCRKNLVEVAIYERALPVNLGGSGLRSLKALRGRLPSAREASGEASLEHTPGGS